MKIYTRKGDEGDTGLFGGRRVSKAHPRVEAYGTVDELSAAIGVAASWTDDNDLVSRLEGVQARLFDVGADIATPPGTKSEEALQRVAADWVGSLESQIDVWDSELLPLASFILPGGSRAAAALHLARTVCRRAERRTTEAIAHGEAIDPAVLAYLNRLSDWLFVAARVANCRSGVADATWRRSGR